MVEKIPVKTKILDDGDNIVEIVKQYTAGIAQQDDIIVISESPLAITQGRAVPEKEIKVGLTAAILWRFVGKVSYGIGLRSPTSMQCAVEEVGRVRILFAALVSALGKMVGRKGDFYKVAGKQAALIDAAHTSPVPPYDRCVIKGPKEPDKVAQAIKDQTGHETAIMDINDIGGSWVVGKSSGINAESLEEIMKDNPQGQGKQLTPICIVRQK